MASKKLIQSPIQVDKDIYYACKYWNDKFVDTDFKIGGVLVYLRKLFGTANGLEHTSFDWKGKRTKFHTYYKQNKNTKFVLINN
jgi:hypothetical protein